MIFITNHSKKESHDTNLSQAKDCGWDNYEQGLLGGIFVEDGKCKFEERNVI